MADDTGLGKTIQAIALIIGRHPLDQEEFKTTLVVVPYGLLQQWRTEILTKTKGEGRHLPKVFLFHGDSKKEKDFRFLRRYDGKRNHRRKKNKI